MEFYGADGVANLSATAEEPPVSLFRADHATGLRGWIDPEPLYRGRATRHGGRSTRDTLVNGVAHLLDHIESGAPLLQTAEHSRDVL